jgi:hypothetical protein
LQKASPLDPNKGLAENGITVRFQKRARNPLLVAAGFAEHPTHIPWLNNRKLYFVFG